MVEKVEGVVNEIDGYFDSKRITICGGAGDLRFSINFLLRQCGAQKSLRARESVGRESGGKSSVIYIK